MFEKMCMGSPRLDEQLLKNTNEQKQTIISKFEFFEITESFDLSEFKATR